MTLPRAPQVTGETSWDLPTEPAIAAAAEPAAKPAAEPAAAQTPRRAPEPEPEAAPAPAPEPEPAPAPAPAPLPAGWEAVQSNSTGETYFKPKSGYVGETQWDRPTAPAAAEEEQPEQRDAPASLYSGSAAEHEVPPVPPEPTLSLSDIAPEALEAVVPPHDPPPVPAVNRARAELRAVVALMPKSSQGAAAAPAPAPAPAPKWACCGSRPQKGGRPQQPRKQQTQAATPRQPAAAPEPAPAAVEEGVPPESAAAAASKLVVTKSNAGLQEGEQQRGAIKAEIDSLESQLDGAVSGATEAEAALSKAEEASKAAVDEARCGSPHSVHPRVCERLQVHLTPGVVFWRICAAGRVT